MELIEPHGGTLKELLVNDKRAEELREECAGLRTWDLTPRQVYDIDLILNGAFSPLEGFLAKKDYDSVCENMRLGGGTIWPMPIMLDVTKTFGGSISAGDRIALRHPEGMVVAVLTIEDVWNPDFEKEASLVFGTTDDTHPGVAYLYHQANPVYIGGKLEGIESPPHHTYRELRHTPAELRGLFQKNGWQKVVAFQTRNPMHRAHVELTRRAIKKADANLLIHPVVGQTKPGDVDYFSRVRCYQAVLANYPESRSSMLSLLPLAMRMGGPREAVWHAIIRKNYGCTHFIVGRDHAGPGKDREGNPFYSPYGAQELVRQHEEELGIEMVDFEEMVYVQELDEYKARSEVPEGVKILTLSGTELRRRLKEGIDIPEWFSYPQVIEELRRTHPPRSKQGFTLFLTGLVGSGKSTVANILTSKLLEYGINNVTLIDEGVIEEYLADGLVNTKKETEKVLKRVGFIAGEITKNQGVAICAAPAPYAAGRNEVRGLVSQYGGFIEVFLSTPLEVSKSRDKKGIHTGAASGEIREYPGVTDAYEPPENPEIEIDTVQGTAEEAAQKIVLYLEHEGYIGGKGKREDKGGS